MSLIGNPLVSTNYQTDTFSGDNSTVAYTLSIAPASAASIAVYISGLYQTPGSAYTVTGTTITFTGAPPTGTGNILVLHLGIKSSTLVPVNGSITPAMLNNANAIFWSASNNNIGVGNTTPTHLLSVGGSMSVTGPTTFANTLTVANSGVTFSDSTQFNTASSFGMRNRFINGAMGIWQRNTSFASIISGTYTADRFVVNVGNLGTAVYTASRSSDVPAGQGFKYSLNLAPSTAMSSVASFAYTAPCQLIEGHNCADLAYGTSAAKTITLSFWVKSNVAGLCCGTVIQNGATNAGIERSYPYNFTIDAVDTWQKIVITIPGDTGGGIVYDNTWGLQFNFGYMAIGTGFMNGTLNSWNANPSGNAYLASGYTYPNRAGSTSNYMRFTGVQVEVGSVATPFEFRQIGTELHLCQRYYEIFEVWATPRVGDLYSHTSVNYRAQKRSATVGITVISNTYGQTLNTQRSNDLVFVSGAQLVSGGSGHWVISASSEL